MKGYTFFTLLVSTFMPSCSYSLVLDVTDEQPSSPSSVGEVFHLGLLQYVTYSQASLEDFTEASALNSINHMVVSSVHLPSVTSRYIKGATSLSCTT